MADFPMRLNRYLALRGHATRRGADDLIARGRVLVNGQVAKIGDKVKESDIVTLAGKRRKAYSYYAYHKPRGVITHSPTTGEREIRELVPELAGEGVFPVGRLDKNSHGLMILTNDGRVTDRLLSPRFEHDKEYLVRTKLPLRSSFKARLEEGVLIEGYQTKPARVRITGDRSFSIILTEGKKHQIRRMVVAMRNEVEDLKRVRVMNVRLGSLKAGEVRPITGEELRLFLDRLGLPSEDPRLQTSQ